MRLPRQRGRGAEKQDFSAGVAAEARPSWRYFWPDFGEVLLRTQNCRGRRLGRLGRSRHLGYPSAFPRLPSTEKPGPLRGCCFPRRSADAREELALFRAACVVANASVLARGSFYHFPA